MECHVETIFNSTNSVSSKAEKFYQNYWTSGKIISEQTAQKNLMILNYFFPKGLYNKTILEIGVGGEGGMIFPLKDKNTIEGVDVSDSAIRNCTELGLSIKKINMDSDCLPFSDEYFDIIFACEVFEHFANPQFAIEEIYRVLKKNGKCIISIPTPYTYHWPRLFYPSLFGEQSFKEFLIINGFSSELTDLCLFKNINNNKNLTELNKRWSWFWSCEKINISNSEGFYNYALKFWEQRDDSSIRIKPIEAIELFRKAYQISPTDYKVKLSFARSLLYRYYLGDHEEFNSLLDSINNDLSKQEYQKNADYLYRFLLIDLESRHLCAQGFDKNIVNAILSLLRNLPDSESYLHRLENEKYRMQVH